MDGTGFDALCLGLYGLEEEDEFINGCQKEVLETKIKEKDEGAGQQNDAQGNMSIVGGNNQIVSETGALSFNSGPNISQIDAKKENSRISTLQSDRLNVTSPEDPTENDEAEKGLGTRVGTLQSTSQIEAVMNNPLRRGPSMKNKSHVTPGAIPLVQSPVPAGMSYSGLAAETGQGAKINSVDKPRHPPSCQNGLGKLGRDALYNSNKMKAEMAHKSQRTFKDVGQGSLVFRCSGLRIKDALVSSSQLEAVVERNACVKLDQIQKRNSQDCIPKRWCTFAVVGEISNPRESSSGNPYTIWKLIDLHECVVSLYLFSNAYRDTKGDVMVGSLVCLVSPRTRKPNERFFISVDSAEQIRILGKAKDFGHCSAKRKDGQPCGVPVNVSKCQYCSQHVEKEYKRMSSMRKELQGGALRTAFKSSARLNFKPGVFEADINSKKPMLPKASSQKLMAAAEKASSRGISRGASYVRTCADPAKALNEVKEEQHARLQTAARQHGKDQAPIPRRHIPNVVCINTGNNKSCEIAGKQDKRRPYLTSLAGRSLLPQTDNQAFKMVELDETESMCDFAHQVCCKLPESSDTNRKKAIEILKRKRDDKKEVEAPGFLVHSLEHHQGKQEDSNIEDAKSAFERKYLAEIGTEDEREIDEPAKSRKSAKSASGSRAGRKQSMPVKKVGTSRTELGNAFGSIIDEMVEKEDKNIHSRFKSIVEAEQDENMKNLLDVLEKKDNMADKMDSIKSMEVQAWECTVCHVILERKHPRCTQMHPNSLKRKLATKRWWKCMDCKQHFSTVGVTYPVGGCPKCDSAQANFEKSSMLKPMSKTMDEMLSGGLACKENLLPRGREQKWVNS